MNETKFCPFRKRTYFMASNSEHTFNVHIERCEFTEEEFLPCLKEKCIMWNDLKHNCKMTNKGE